MSEPCEVPAQDDPPQAPQLHVVETDRAAEAEGEPAPGSPQAIEHGCACSVLANASYRAGAVADPCIDPLCRMHNLLPEDA